MKEFKLNPINTQPPQVQITSEMMKGFDSVKCECGGIIFQPGIIFKKISALISPTGKEESYPLEVFVCNKCGYVPSFFNIGNILPDEIIAKPKQ